MPTRAARLMALAKLLFPPACALHAQAINAAQPPLMAQEQIAVQVAVPARQLEFAAGRASARAALAALGYAPVAIPMGSDRAPVWPKGICGSISHADGIAMAVVAHQVDGLSLGLDIEADRNLPADLLPLILTQPERQALEEGDLSKARLIFAAKEAFYKCQYPLTKTVLDFSAVEIGFPADGQLSARFCQDVAPFTKGSILTGYYRRAEGLWLVGFTYEATTLNEAGHV